MENYHKRKHIVIKPKRLCSIDNKECHFPKEGCFGCERRNKEKDK